SFEGCLSYSKISTPSSTSGETPVKSTQACFPPTHPNTRTFVGRSVDLPSCGSVKKFTGASFFTEIPARLKFFGGSEISPSPPAPTASGNNGHMLYVFNRNGICLLYREWNRPLHTLNAQQDHKLMFGLLFSLKSLTAKMDPTRSRLKDLRNTYACIVLRPVWIGLFEFIY
ncbi:trafficking protein particle complex subunit 1-like protein, partial [Trifolium pratense]